MSQPLGYKDMLGDHALNIDALYLSRRIGDLVHSDEDIEDAGLLQNIDQISIAMEYTEQRKSTKPFLIQ